MEEKKYNELIKSVIKALDIMEVMSTSTREVGVKDLSDTFKVGKSTIHRFLSTLEYKGYVEQIGKKGKYRLTLKLFELGNNILQSLDLHTCSFSVLQELNKQLGETVHLTLLDKGDAVIINKFAGPPALVTYSYIGKRTHAHCLATGKVLLASLPEEEMEKIVKEKGLPKYTSNTIDSFQELKIHLEKVRQEDLGYDFEEYQLGINGVAAPIRNHLGEVIAAASVSGSIMVLTREKINDYARELKKATQKISQNIGYRQK